MTLDSAAHMVLQRGQPVELTPREFALLEQLMRNRGAAIYRDTLMERAWGGDAETPARWIPILPDCAKS